MQAATAVLLRDSPELRDVADAVQLAAIRVAQQAGQTDTLTALQPNLADFSKVAFPPHKTKRRWLGRLQGDQ